MSQKIEVFKKINKKVSSITLWLFTVPGSMGLLTVNRLLKEGLQTALTCGANVEEFLRNKKMSYFPVTTVLQYWYFS